MTEITTIEYDVATGLPVLPEGYFWRVGETDYQDYWYSSTPRMKPSVLIMKTEGVVTKKRKIPVYGKSWWNKHKIVDETVETYEELGGPIEVMRHKFEEIRTSDNDSIPDYAQSYCVSSLNGVELEWEYTIPMNAEGIAFIAVRLFAEWTERKKEIAASQEIERAKLEAKEKFYGDYPPKSLVK